MGVEWDADVQDSDVRYVFPRVAHSYDSRQEVPLASSTVRRNQPGANHGHHMQAATATDWVDLTRQPRQRLTACTVTHSL